jgi:CRP/FNR family transcriptional regulator
MENIKIDFLKNAYLFSSLTDEELKQISGEIVVEEFKKHDTILHEEDTNEFMYIILFGKVKVSRTTQDGKEIILALHQTNDSFGELSLIDGKTTPATVSAIEDSLIAFISKKAFYSILSDREKVLEKILHIFCSRLRESWNKIFLLNFRNAAQKIKMLFLMLSHEYAERTSDGIMITVKLTHQEIADMTGLTRETVTRVIDKLQKDKEISVLDNKFIRLNNEFLQKYSDM